MNRSSSRLFAAALATLALALSATPLAAAPDAPPPIAQPFKDVGLWYGQFGGTICSWLDTGNGVFVIDTGSTTADATRLKAEIARTTRNKPVKWIALTHLHADSNDGLVAFLPADVTIFVNAKSTALLVGLAERAKGVPPNIVGVGERLVLAAGKVRVEVGVPPANAHTASDLYVFDAQTRTAFVGDLVTPDRCPMLSDPDSDLKGWLLALDRLDTLKPAALVATRGNPATNATSEIEKTRRYLTSMLQYLMEKKKQNAPEARVTGELSIEKIATYCPKELSAVNALSVYRRIAIDGSTVPGTALQKEKAQAK